MGMTKLWEESAGKLVYFFSVGLKSSEAEFMQ
jgi:hypothetical protein